MIVQFSCAAMQQSYDWRKFTTGLGGGAWQPHRWDRRLTRERVERMISDKDPFLNLLRELGELAGDDLAPNEHRLTTLTFDGVDISLENPAQSPFLYFHAPIKRLSSDSAHELGEAMKLNLFHLPLTGSWLALDAETEELVLCFSAPLETTTAANLGSTIQVLASAVTDLRHESQMHQPHGRPSYQEDGAQAVTVELDTVAADNFWVTKL